jgi:gliding motility-associated-like protein
MRAIAFLFFVVIVAMSGLAQAGAEKIRWQSDPFEHKVFVENKGQLDGMNGLKRSSIRYAVMSEGVAIYFTSQGLTYRHDEYRASASSKATEKEREEHKPESISQFVHMEWEGADPNAEIIPEDKASYYFMYPDIKASAFKKIIYKNIYPNIDVEYTFPEDKPGIKYSIILHPGADPSLVKMKYSGVENMFADAEGNVRIQSPFGEFIDHAPRTFYAADHATIPSSFTIKNNIVSFALPSPLSPGRGDGGEVVIDPWTTNPNFPGFNAAYDIDYDYAGNVYVYGGQYSGSNYYQEIKLNSAGVIQWVFTTTPFNYAGYYGDFAVDANSGSSYIAEGLNIPSSPNPGSRMLKLNAAGVQTALYPGNANMKEIWRMTFNSCTKKGVVGGSGWNVNYQAAVFDTTLASMNPVNILPGGLQDLDLLAIDNSNNCFMGFATNGGSANNQMLKCPASTLAPIAYNVYTNFQMTEIQSVNYVNNTTGPNGMNGIAVNSTNLYTYNGSKLKRYNKNTGIALDSVILTPPVYCCFPNFFLQISWGGITVDECNNIFVGSHDTIFQLSPTYNKVAFIKTNGNLYDLKLGPNNLLYACGKTFVSSFPSGVICNSLNASVNSSGSCSASSATVTVTGGNPPYTYLWNPSGQTMQVVTGLAAGTYTVMIKDNSCPPNIQTATVTIAPGAIVPSINSSPASCLASNGTATVTPNGGTAPYTYSWSPSGGTNATASGLAAGNYSVTVTDATGCSGTSTVAITFSGGPAVSIFNQTNILCNGINTGSVSVNASGGTSPYTYSWSPSGGTTSAATGLSAGNYTATITDANGCSSTQTLSITQPTAITATISSTAAACGNNNGTATVAVSGGTGAFTYFWSPGGQTTASLTGLGAGIYTTTVTDANGCTNVQTVSVNQPSTITATATATPTPCGLNNGSAAVNASGGTSPFTYAWSPTGQTSSAITGLAAGNYTATVTDAGGCSISTIVTVISTGGPTASVSADLTILSGSSATLTAGGGGTYSWSSGENTSPITVAPSVTTIYCVTVSDVNNCLDTACVTITVLPEPIDCSPSVTGEMYLPNAFSPNGDNENEVIHIYYGDMRCIQTFELHIYNRWGEVVFETTNPVATWDGYYKGKVEDSAVFTYYMKAKLTTGKEIVRKGNISLTK